MGTRALKKEEYLFAEGIAIMRLSATEAAARAGYQHPHKLGSRLMRRPLIVAQIDQMRRQTAEAHGINEDKVFKQWVQIANADPNELMEIRRNCCRHCHGKDFRYQRTKCEMREARSAHEESRLKAKAAGRTIRPFDEEGGEGYDRRRAPNRDCPECHGEGVMTPFIRPTRSVSEGARRLIAGVKVHKNGGVEIKMRDQDAALLNIAMHLGMLAGEQQTQGDLTAVQIYLPDNGMDRPEGENGEPTPLEALPPPSDGQPA
jgi:phage terminase small subunit